MLKLNNLGEGNVFKLLLKLTIPSMLAQFVNVLYSIVDRIFISNIPGVGDTALAGVGICIPIVTLITSFCYLVGLGGAPLVAIKLGEKNQKDAQKILANCFIMLLVLSALITIVCLIFKRNLLYLFGANADTYTYANQYMTVYLCGSVFAMLSLGLNSFITCQGFSKIAMSSVIIGAIINIILDPILIFTFNMGVTGAGIATVIAQFVSCIWVLIFLISKSSIIKLSFRGFSLKTAKKIMILGFSPFMIMMTESVIIIALNVVLEKFGGNNSTSLISGATIVVCFMQIITLPLGGITMGAQPIIGFNYGAGNFDRITSAVKGLLLICFCFTTLMFICAMALPHYFVKIFTSDSAISDIAIWGIRIYTGGVIFLTLQYTFVDTLTALSCPQYAIFLSLFRKLGLILSLTIILPIFFSAQSAFFAEMIADIISGCLSTIVFAVCYKKIVAKRKNQLINVISLSNNT